MLRWIKAPCLTGSGVVVRNPSTAVCVSHTPNALSDMPSSGGSLDPSPYWCATALVALPAAVCPEVCESQLQTIQDPKGHDPLKDIVGGKV